MHGTYTGTLDLAYPIIHGTPACPMRVHYYVKYFLYLKDLPIRFPRAVHSPKYRFRLPFNYRIAPVSVISDAHSHTSFAF